LDPDTVTVTIRVTGGNFPLLNRLLTQMQRTLEINALNEVTKAVVDQPFRGCLQIVVAATKRER
jgi:hypothetical protein